MEKFRSKSCRDGGMQIESYCEGRAAPTSMHDLRSYSTSYVSSIQPSQLCKDEKMKKSKSGIGSSASRIWSLSDPELQRKKRVATYKVYALEGKMKGSLRKSFRWIKNTYTQAVYGWW